MKKLMNAVDRFCYRHPRFGIPNLMIYIVIANAIIWVFSLMDTSGLLYEWLSFSPWHVLRGQVWRLVSFALMPHSYGWLALIAFYFYYFIGSNIERQWGSGKFTIYVLSGIVLTDVYGFLLYFAYGGGEALSAFIGQYANAYYIYLSMFFTFATLWPDMQVLLFFIIPVKMKWLAWLDAALFAYEIIAPLVRFPSLYNLPFCLFPAVAVLNYLLFCGYELFAVLRPARVRQRRNTVNFQQEVRRMQYEQRQKPYTRRCEVCGRTDASDPELEFRYCSRCQGYHCFCIDHINNHRHFTE